MIRISLYSIPMNDNLPTYLGLYRMNGLLDFEQKCNVNWFYETANDRLDIEYNEDNRGKIIELYQKLKMEKWEGNLIVFCDDEKLSIPDCTMIGYDICADSMYYSPLGDGFLLEYNKYPEFFSEMTSEKYLAYKRNINEKWLFNSYDVALDFAKYCIHINKKHRYCIESEDKWRPFAIYLLEL